MWKKILKGDWRNLIDDLVVDKIDLDTIHSHLAKILGYATPSIEEIRAYMDQNYKRDKLWSNVWGNNDEE
tara:strand:+ start:1034 stop:1243 length:210 start_codon:yes stop_codon:yes gene_type:complete